MSDPSPREVLDWYAEAGVDVALADEPINRFEEAEQAFAVAQEKQNTRSPEPVNASAGDRPSSPQGIRSAPAQRIAETAPPATRPTLPDGVAVEQARELASSAKSLEQLRNAIAGFDGCNLRFQARQAVFADGNPEAEIMIIGEAPGRDEDAQGLPFVGKSGQLLDRMLEAIGLDRNSVYVSNVIPWRPAGNRTPTPAEVEICRPFIERHIELANPELLILVGGSSAKAMLQTTEGITAVRGRWKEVTVGENVWPALPMFHPAYLLRNPAQKRRSWQDLLTLKKRLTGDS